VHEKHRIIAFFSLFNVARCVEEMALIGRALRDLSTWTFSISRSDLLRILRFAVLGQYLLKNRAVADLTIFENSGVAHQDK